MSDQKDLGGFGDLDWDSALDEWEKNTFVPVMANEAESNPDLAARPSTGVVAIPSNDEELAAAAPGGTVIAPVPEELREEAFPSTGNMPVARMSSPGPSPSSNPGRASLAPRGGLDQLFSRPRSALSGRPIALPPSEQTRVAPRASFELGSLPSAIPASLDSEREGESETLIRENPLSDSDIDLLSRDIPSVPPRAGSNAPRPNPRPSRTPSASVSDADTTEHPSLRTRPPAIPDRGADLGRVDDEVENATVVQERISISDADTATKFPSDGAPTAGGETTMSLSGDTATSLPIETADDLRAERPASLRPATAARAPADDEMPTIGRPSHAPSPSALPPGYAPTTARMGIAQPATDRASSFGAERQASRWLDEQATKAHLSRIAWLEEEARALADPTARARGLLAVSELCALVDDQERAYALAVEARDLAPQLPLAWRQARQLMPHDADVLAEALEGEAARAPTPSARAHAVLLAADLLRTNGRGDSAVECWDSACKLDPADTRAPIARAALALAQNDHTSGTLRLADNSELVSLDKAVATALRLRGVERPGAEVDDMPLNDGLRHARTALLAGDVVAAAQSIGEIASLPEMAQGALWLSASLGTIHIASRRAAARALKTLVAEGDPLAHRQLAARGVELGDPELVATTLAATDGVFDPAERATLAMLSAKGEGVVLDSVTSGAIGRDRSLAPLADALAAISPILVKDGDPDAAIARAERTAGTTSARALATLGRLLASNVGDVTVDAALANIARPRAPSAAGIALEAAARSKRWDELSDALASLPASEETAKRHIAAAIVADRAGNRERARDAWSEAARGAPQSDGLLRIAADLDPEIDLTTELLLIANDLPDGVTAAILRLEALARGGSLSDDEQASQLERVHRTAPALGIGGFLAERIGRRRGDLDEVLRWIQERRAYATDPIEVALDAVREAFLIADRDPELAATRLEEARHARPDDVALRELHERLAVDPASDRGEWREKRAAAATGAAAPLAWIEAALEYDRAGDTAATLRAARKAAAAGDRGLAAPMIERAERATGDTVRQVEELLAITKESADTATRREAYERLAQLDTLERNDTSGAIPWHRSILEDAPRHKPSLRAIEHALIGQGRDDELTGIFEQIAFALDGVRGGETTAHAQHAARLHAREAAQSPGEGPSAWERTHDMTRLAATQPEPSLWALRTLNAHARVAKDDAAILKTTIALLERTHRPPERATLLLRASESSARLEQIADARVFLEQAASEDPGDVVTWGFLAEIRERTGEAREAAEACESLARTSGVREHQLLAWHDAAKIWTDEVKDPERAMTALEAAAEVDATYADVFARLSALYAEKKLDAELARLLERRLATIEDVDERVGLEVDLSRAFVDMGELAKAKATLGRALEQRPDHTTALSEMADLCAKEGDWTGAEQAYVRLARLLSDPSEQRAIYERLGEIYTVHSPNLTRAETAWREVRKRAPNDRDVLTKLVEIYRRQGNVQQAVEAQQELVSASTDPDVRLAGLIELAKIHENVGKDPRRSEQVLDSARKEFPTSVVALRAMAEFYSRQRQMPAMQILLDRAAGDARRAFAQGRFVPSLFQVLHAAYELRGKRDASRVVAATLAAVEGQRCELAGADARAVDPRLDDLLPPEMMNPALRALLFQVGDALDAVAPVDLRALRAAPLPPGTTIGATVGSIATYIGLGALQVLVSPNLGRVAIPLATNPPTILVGEGLAKVPNERARMFVVVRAMKMIVTRSSAMLRGTPQDISGLIAGLFTALNPSFTPQGMDAKRASEQSRRIVPALPRSLDPTVGVIALEAAGMVGNQWAQLGPAASTWANRVALLAVGDPNAALDAIAWSQNEDAAPTGSEERAAWIARHAEARDLMTFSVTDAYSEARARLGLDK